MARILVKHFSCDALKDKLPTIIKSGEDFGQVLWYLDTELCKAVCDALKDKLPAIIKNGEGFCEALKYLDVEEREIVFNVLKDELPKIIKNYNDFYKAFTYLTVDQSIVVCNTYLDTLGLKSQPEMNNLVNESPPNFNKQNVINQKLTFLLPLLFSNAGQSMAGKRQRIDNSSMDETTCKRRRSDQSESDSDSDEKKTTSYIKKG